MWTEITRPQYERSGLRYASDLTDKEWKVIAPHLPARKRHGRPRTTDLREVLNAILYMARTGCQWRMLPAPAPRTWQPGRPDPAFAISGLQPNRAFPAAPSLT